MRTIKFWLICVIDWIDTRIIGHRFYWLCQKIGFSNWWPDEEDWDGVNPLLGPLTIEETKSVDP